MHKSLKITLFFAALILFYVAALHLLPDQELAPETSAWLEHHTRTLPEEQNAYHFIWGLEAPPGMSMLEFSKKQLAYSVNNEGRAAKANKSADEDDLANRKRIRSEGLSQLCHQREQTCLDIYQQHFDSLLEKGDNALLLKRYVILSAKPHYHAVEPYSIDSLSPYYSLLINSQRLHHVQAVSKYLEGRQREALAGLRNDLTFNRMLIQESDILITRLIAVNMAENTLQTYSQLLELKDAEEVISAVKEISPLSEDEYSLLQVFRGELQFQKSILEMLEHEPSDELEYLSGIIFSGVFPLRMNRMLNISQSRMARYHDMTHFKPSLIKKKSQQIEALERNNGNFWEYLYDPLNATYFSATWPQLDYYIVRHHDLDGLIRLVKLKALIKERDIPPTEINSFIAASPYASAYADEMNPVRWNPEEHSLYFTSANSDETAETVKIYSVFD